MKKDTSTEDKILQAGRELFSLHGYAATSMSDIAKEIGITKASLYYFFKNKQALYIKVLIDLIEKVADIYATEPSKSPQDDLREIVLKILKVSEKYGSMLQNIDSSKLDTTTAEFKVIIKRMADLDIQTQELLKKCGVKNPVLAAHTLNASNHAYLQRIQHGLKDITRTEYAKYITQLLLK